MPPTTLTDCPKPGAVPVYVKPPEPHRPELSDSWKQWVAENVIRRCDADSMVSTMMGVGQDPVQSRRTIAGMDKDPVFQAALKMRDLRDKLGTVMDNLQRIAESAPDYLHVERRSRVPRDEFVSRYVLGQRPVILTDVARDWPALGRWRPELLKQRFGEIEVEVQAGRSWTTDYEVNKAAHKRRMKFGDFIDLVLATGPTNDHYLTANNEVLRRPEFASLLDDIGTLPDLCVRADLQRSGSFWFGPQGTLTPLHHDTLMLFHTQVLGRKRWRMVSPLNTHRLYNHYHVFSPVDLSAIDAARFPDAVGLKVLDVTLEAGETLFVPLAWWHQVEALELGFSFSYTNLSIPNNFEFHRPNITTW